MLTIRIHIVSGLPFAGERPTCERAHLVRHPETPGGREDVQRIIGQEVTQLMTPIRRADPIRTLMGRPEVITITVRQLYSSDPLYRVRSDGRCWIQVSGTAASPTSPGIKEVMRLLTTVSGE